MKKLFFIFSVVLLASCGNQDTSKVLTSKDNVSLGENPEEMEIDTNSLEVDADMLKSHAKPGPYANPFFIYGSDFGNFFQTLYVHGKFDEMLAFTSSQSKAQFGEEVILDFYKNGLDFGYDIGKHPISNATTGDIITLNYKVDIMATKKIIRVNVVVENDSCKVVLPDNLKNFPS